MPLILPGVMIFGPHRLCLWIVFNISGLNMGRLPFLTQYLSDGYTTRSTFAFLKKDEHTLLENTETFFCTWSNSQLSELLAKDEMVS